MTAETDTLTQAMIDAARAGARCLMEDFAALERLEVRTKRPADFVSEADLRAEQAIREVLTRATPTYGLLLEESGVHAGQRADRRWLVDPLDGTTVTVQGGSATRMIPFGLSGGPGRRRRPGGVVRLRPCGPPLTTSGVPP